MPPPYSSGKTITVHRKTVSGQDRYGVDEWSSDDADIAGCACYQTATTEDVAGRDMITTGVTVLAPDGSDVLATDTVTVDGLLYQVAGEPISWANPLTGSRPGVEIRLVRATG